MWNGHGVEAENYFLFLLLLFFTVAVNHEGRNHIFSRGIRLLYTRIVEKRNSSYNKIIVQSPFLYPPD